MHEERIKKKTDCSASFREVVECLKMQSEILQCFSGNRSEAIFAQIAEKIHSPAEKLAAAS
jgi:hypothetical protein